MDNQAVNNFLPIITMIIVMGFMYLFLIRPQKKKEDALKKLRDSIEIGDEIVTIGGIIGRVVSIKEDNILIETGSDRNKLRIRRWAVQTVEKIHI